MVPNRIDGAELLALLELLEPQLLKLLKMMKPAATSASAKPIATARPRTCIRPLLWAKVAPVEAKGKLNPHALTYLVTRRNVGLWGFNTLVSERGLPLARWPPVIAGDWFSPILINNPGSGYEVTGELNSLDDSALLFLDDLEGVGAPFGFTRTEIIVAIRSLPVWTYSKPSELVSPVHEGPLARYDADLVTYRENNEANRIEDSATLLTTQNGTYARRLRLWNLWATSG